MNIVLASHISDLSGPTEALLGYLRRNGHDVLAVLNPLEYCETAVRSVVLSDGTRIVSERKPANLRQPAVLSWLIDAWLVLVHAASYRGSIDLFIGCDPLNAAVGAALKKTGKVKTLVYYSVDWSQRRFGSGLVNRAYYYLDRVCLRSCDRNWCVAPSLIRQRMRQGINRKKLVLVPIGIQAVPQRRDSKARNKLALVFLGALERTKGIDLVIRTWPRIRKKFPRAKLVVMGKTPQGVTDRPYEERLREMPGVELLGVVTHDEVMRRLPAYGIGLAPYTDDPDSVTRFADPSRIKDYLAAGLPVITTKVPDIHREIAAAGAGAVVASDADSLLHAIGHLTGNSYDRYRKNSHTLGLQYDWNTVFSEALRKSI